MFHRRRRRTDEGGRRERSHGSIGRARPVQPSSRRSPSSPPPPPQPPRPRPRPQSPSDPRPPPPVTVAAAAGLAMSPRTSRFSGRWRLGIAPLVAMSVVLAQSCLLSSSRSCFSGRRIIVDAAGAGATAFLPPPPLLRTRVEMPRVLESSAPPGGRSARSHPSFAALGGLGQNSALHRRDPSRPSVWTSQHSSSSSSSPLRAAVGTATRTHGNDEVASPAASPATSAAPPVSLSFSHLHLYVDSVDDLSAYKSLEDDLNRFADALRRREDEGDDVLGSSTTCSGRMDVERCRSIWRSIIGGSGAGDDAMSEGEDNYSEGATTFVGQGRDVVRQLIAGLGFRVTGCRMPGHVDGDGDGAVVNTRSVLVTSPDPRGVQFVVTAPAGDRDGDGVVDVGEKGGIDGSRDDDPYGHFDASNLRRFSSCHGGRQGVAVLAFHVGEADSAYDGGEEPSHSSSPRKGTLEEIYDRYAELHPNLLVGCDDDDDLGAAAPLGIRRYDEADILEVYAYYAGDDGESGSEKAKDSRREADKGTVLRFVQSRSRAPSSSSASDGSQKPPPMPLPGLTAVPAKFDGTSQPAYCDHWVSNVLSRTGFISTLSDTLGFTPKVNFNAGVVAAGESQIESTVAGNDSPLVTSSPTVALRDQSQVYLPINNALSPVGHVHGFLTELGQGVQHVASRVDDLVAFVQRGNDYRKITGDGFAFLNIPRSYYGVLSEETLAGDAGVSTGCALAVIEACCNGDIATPEGAVHLDLSEEDVGRILDDRLAAESSFSDPRHLDEYRSNRSEVVRAILRSRYVNLSNLLGDRLTEETYLGIVRNQILVDVQGDDLLFQIFTGNVMQRRVGEESPFLEFIQRVCAKEPTTGGDGDDVARGAMRNDVNGPLIKPGCGGFGIRNFLTLFLSIEVSKAMTEAARAGEEGDEERRAHFRKVVDIFTDQLNESNPILTDIADAMTAEGDAEAEVRAALRAGDEEAAAEWRRRVRAAADSKEAGNERLMACSEKYRSIMRKFREESGVR